MNFLELQVTLSFCVIFSLRILGMFMILPVLSKYGMTLDGGNKILIGLSIGIYGISQVFFQIPFGILSDKFSRKKIIILGLFLFFIGNVVAASFHSIWGLIIGRFLQGSGAISGVCMAFLSDVIKEKNRVKSIAVIGASFPVSFLISIITGPIVIQYCDFFSLFWISSILSIFCIMIVFFALPESERLILNKNVNYSYKIVLNFIFDRAFFRFYLGIFFLHFLLMINFMILPNELELSGFSLNNHWKVYLSTVLISFFVLFFFILNCKSKFILKNIIEICIFFLFVSSFIFLKSHNNLLFLVIALQVFFISFNFLEVFLPSELSKNISNNYYKGRIMSIYSVSQFLGIFFGGTISGYLSSYLNIYQIFLFQMLIISFWFLISFIRRIR